MLMPEKIEHTMFAPCGMNCKVCYKHCFSKKSCAGCLNTDEGKPEHCRKCRIKDCVKAKGLTHCYTCSDFPCAVIKRLDKSYRTRYGVSLVQNSLQVKEKELPQFLEEQKRQFTCGSCGGIISLHDRQCSQCQVKVKIGFSAEEKER